MRLLLVLSASYALLALAACGSEGEGGDLDITLSEYSIETSVDSLPEGPIKIDIKNDGPDDDHELVIIRTDIPPGELPTNDDGSVDEDASGLSIEREIEDIEPGDETSRSYTLDPGSYVFICNIVEDEHGETHSHYQEGMRTAFTVTEDK